MQIILVWPDCTLLLIGNFYVGKWLLPKVRVFSSILKKTRTAMFVLVFPAESRLGGGTLVEVTALCGSEKREVTQALRAGVRCWRGARGVRELLVPPCLPVAAAGRVPWVPQGV